MSDSDESGVTHTEISSPFEDLSDIGSPGVLPYGPAIVQTTYWPRQDDVDYPADEGDDSDDEDESSGGSPSAERKSRFERDEIPSPTYLQIPCPTTTVSSPVPVLSPSPPASPIRLLGYRAAMIRLRAEAASTSHSLPLPPPIILSHTRPAAPSSGTPPLHLLSTDRREDIPKVTLPPRKRLGIALGPAYEVGESSSAAARPARGLRADYGFVATMDREIRHDPERDVGYGITDSWDEIVETLQGAPVSTDTELGRHMTAFETRVRQDTNEIYTRLDDEQSGRQLLAGRLNMLFRDRRAHARTARLMDTEARMSREAWGRSKDVSNLARAEETDGDYRDAGGRSQEAEAAHRGTEADKETSNSNDRVREIARTRQRSCIARATGGGW
ncbi:hypothetical protein Tco_0978869 [Tanacetum coccineum]|uniref:Uncharacterized protein n=1 Tax=Tanacetum coccineum TaxID=301880 RepID=A0ABQ5EPB6_9ASTR